MTGAASGGTGMTGATGSTGPTGATGPTGPPSEESDVADDVEVAPTGPTGPVANATESDDDEGNVAEPPPDEADFKAKVKFKQGLTGYSLADFDGDVKEGFTKSLASQLKVFRNQVKILRTKEKPASAASQSRFAAMRSLVFSAMGVNDGAQAGGPELEVDTEVMTSDTDAAALINAEVDAIASNPHAVKLDYVWGASAHHIPSYRSSTNPDTVLSSYIPCCRHTVP